MHTRCTNPNFKSWRDYGGRGITICDRWLGDHGFENFLADMDVRPAGMTLDRIDSDGNYEPSNCRWADKKFTQARNRRWRSLGRGPAKLTAEQVAEIRRLCDEGWKQSDIGDAYGIHQSTVSSIHRGETWGHLHAPLAA